MADIKPLDRLPGGPGWWTRVDLRTRPPWSSSYTSLTWSAGGKLGKPATGLEWRFHHYGPYSAELERDINDNAFLHVFGDRHSGYGFSPSSQWEEIRAACNARFDPAVRRVADGVVNQWSLEGLETILEYVYFETEPMQDARRGEHLDFTRIQPEDRPARSGASLEFSNEFISNLRTRGISAGRPLTPPTRGKRLRRNRSTTRSTKRHSG